MPAPARHRSADLRWAVSPGAVIAWMAVNVGCLLLGLSQVPLAPGYPSGSVLLPELLIAGQLVFAALLAPLLIRSAATILVVTISCWPGLLLAGGLAARPINAILLSAAVVVGWLFTLYFWTVCFRSTAIRQIVSAVAVLLAAGPALLAYLATEFGPAEPAERFHNAAAVTPIRLAWDYANGAEAGWAASLPMALLLLLGAAIWISRRCCSAAERL